ncbi:MAG: hypothetical protein K2N34_13565 [Lachnospiraceae bacterium]|nr:hypothetical protein [Lachnospiraceae bacterium]
MIINYTIHREMVDIRTDLDFSVPMSRTLCSFADYFLTPKAYRKGMAVSQRV